MELFQVYNNDLVLNVNSDLKTVNGSELNKQRILRRLLTQKGTYLWHPDYGASLPSYIGQPLTQALSREIKGNIKTQMFLENSVKRTPEPKIALSTNGNNLICEINFEFKNSDKVFTLSFSIEE